MSSILQLKQRKTQFQTQLNFISKYRYNGLSDDNLTNFYVKRVCFSTLWYDISEAFNSVLRFLRISTRTKIDNVKKKIIIFKFLSPHFRKSKT